MVRELLRLKYVDKLLQQHQILHYAGLEEIFSSWRNEVDVVRDVLEYLYVVLGVLDQFIIGLGGDLGFICNKKNIFWDPQQTTVLTYQTLEFFIVLEWSR